MPTPPKSDWGMDAKRIGVALVQRAQCGRRGPIRSDRLRDADGIRASGIDHAVEDGDADGSLGLLAR